MKTELEEIKKELESTLEGFKDAYDFDGYDLANERYYVETALKKVNLLLLHIVVGSTTTDEWEVLLSGECFTNGLRTEDDCLAEIEYGKRIGHEGIWSYREIVKTYSVGKSVTL